MKAFLAAGLLGAAAPVSAQVSDDSWWAAESAHFKVLSAGTREDAEQMAVKLERLDQALRLTLAISKQAAPYPATAKPTVYQFGTASDIGRLAGRSGVMGFFIPRAGQSVGFVPLVAEKGVNRSGSPGTRASYEFYSDNVAPDEVLFHEYTHYFMFQHAPAAYPSWYIEGFAELFGMIELTPTGFNIGEAPESRKAAIQLVDVEQQSLFDPPKDRRSAVVDYAHGWLATSYLSFEPSRRGQLAKYLSLLNRGTASKAAATQAFGDLEKLEDELNAYRRQRARGLAAQFADQSVPKVTVRALTAAENARMTLQLRAKSGVTRAEAKAIVGDARKLAASHPKSLPVLLAATEAEFDAGNLIQADALAARALAIDPNSIEALLYRANVAMEHAKKDPAFLTQARTHFVAANRVDNDHPVALAGYYLTYILAGQTPPEGAVIALESAYRTAPFDNDIRRTLAHLLLTEKRDRDAMAVLGPIVNSPHAGKKARELRELIAKLDAGERQPLIDELKPKLDDDDQA